MPQTTHMGAKPLFRVSLGKIGQTGGAFASKLYRSAQDPCTSQIAPGNDSKFTCEIVPFEATNEAMQALRASKILSF